MGVFLFLPLPAHAGPAIGPGLAGINAEGYEGGDPAEMLFVEAREKLGRALELIQKDQDLSALCQPRRCENSADAGLCGAVRWLRRKQAEECRAFIVATAPEMQQLNNETVVPLRVSAIPLTVWTPKKEARRVSAITTAGPKGPIIVYYESLRGLSTGPLLALLGHELSHKVKVPGSRNGFIDDYQSVGSFKSGRAFLDAVGASLSVYALEHALPAQVPPPLPEGIASAALCAPGSTPPSRYLVGLALDFQHRLPSVETVGQWVSEFGDHRSLDRDEARLAAALKVLSQKESRAVVVRELFQQLMFRAPDDDEMDFMLGKISSGAPYDSVVAAIMGSKGYAEAHGATGMDLFLSAAYLDLVGSRPTARELSVLLPRVSSLDRPTIVQGILRRDPRPVTALVQLWYQSYLNRAPTGPEIAASLKEAAAGASWEAIRAQLVSGQEYAALQVLRFNHCPITTAATK